MHRRNSICLAVGLAAALGQAFLAGRAVRAGDSPSHTARQVLAAQQAELERFTAQLEQLRQAQQPKPAAAVTHTAQREPAAPTASDLPAEPLREARDNILRDHGAQDDPMQAISLSVRTTKANVTVYAIDGSNISLWQLLRRLARESQVPICVDRDISSAEMAERISVSLEDVSLPELMEIVLGTQGLDFRFDGRAVYVTKGPKLGFSDRAHYLDERASKVYRQALVKYPQHASAPAAYHALAESHMRQEMYVLAVQEFSAELALGSDAKLMGPARYNLGVCFLELGDTRRARGAFKHVLDRSPTDDLADEAHMSIARAWQRDGDFERASLTYRTVLRAYANSNSAQPAALGLARCLYRCGRFDEAIAEYDRLARRSRDRVLGAEASFFSAEALYRAEKFTDAALRYREFLAAYRDSPFADDAYYRYGDCRLKGQDYLAAIEAFAGAADRFPDSPHAPRGAYSMAKAYAALGFPDDAIKALRRALDLCGSHQVDHAGEPTAGALSDYAEDITRACAQGNENDRRQIWLLMADCYRGKEQHLRASTLYGRVAESHDDDMAMGASLQQARCLFQRQKYPEALATCRQIIASEKECDYVKEAFRLAGNCLVRIGRLDEASDAYSGRIAVQLKTPDK